MRRIITQIGQSISDWFFTKPAQDNMVALGKLAAAVLGTSTVVNGLAATPTSPASLQVNVAAGEIYTLANLEATAFGSLPVDTTHQIVKQGISLDVQQLAFTAPTTTGFSVNYLIQASFAEEDVSVDPSSGTSPVIQQFYNADNPTQPWNGPNNNGQTSATFRNGKVVLSLKQGVAAATGSQTTPTPDAGSVGLYQVTLANGQTTIAAGNISMYGSAPFITERLGDKIGLATGDARYLPASSVVTPTSDPTYASSSNSPASTSWIRGAMSAIATAAGFAVSLNANGYVKLPSWLGGFVLQWGTTGSIGATSASSVTFPLTFPANCGAVVTSRASSSGSQRADTVASITTSSFTIGNGSADTASVFRFFAIGY